jgi:hypothetical protein
MAPSRTIVLVAAAATLALAACGGDGDSTDQDFVTALVEQGATEDQAECLADELDADLRDAFVSGADAPDSAADGQAVLDAYEACEIDLTDSGAASDSGEDASGEEPDSDDEAGGDEVSPDALLACLEGAGFDAAVEDGPQTRVYTSGEGGSGVVYFYDSEASASDAVDQFIDAFSGTDGMTIGSSGALAYTYEGAPDEATQVEGCLSG